MNRRITEAINGMKISPGGGFCRGIALLTSQAWLSGEEEALQQLVQLMRRINPQIMHFAIAQAKRRLVAHSGNAKTVMIAVNAFLECIALAQNAERFSGLFEKNSVPRSQREMKAMLSLIASKKMEDAGGMHLIKSFSGLYQDKLELAAYLTSMVNHLHTVAPEFTGRISITLQSINHSYMIGYDASMMSFYMNDDDKESYKSFAETLELAEVLMQEFNEKDITVFSTEVYASGRDKNVITAVMESYCKSDVYNSFHDVNKKALLMGKNNVTWLLVASQNGHAETVMKLLAAGADANQADASNRFALLYAAETGAADVVSILLNGGANINQVDNDNSTALICTSDCGYLEVVKVLLAADADTSIIATDVNQTAEMFAMTSGHDDIATLIHDYEMTKVQ